MLDSSRNANPNSGAIDLGEHISDTIEGEQYLSFSGEDLANSNAEVQDVVENILERRLFGGAIDLEEHVSGTVSCT